MRVFEELRLEVGKLLGSTLCQNACGILGLVFGHEDNNAASRLEHFLSSVTRQHRRVADWRPDERLVFVSSKLTHAARQAYHDDK